MAKTLGWRDVTSDMVISSKLAFFFSFPFLFRQRYLNFEITIIAFAVQLKPSTFCWNYGYNPIRSVHQPHRLRHCLAVQTGLETCIIVVEREQLRCLDEILKRYVSTGKIPCSFSLRVVGSPFLRGVFMSICIR